MTGFISTATLKPQDINRAVCNLANHVFVHDTTTKENTCGTLCNYYLQIIKTRWKGLVWEEEKCTEKNAILLETQRMALSILTTRGSWKAWISSLKSCRSLLETSLLTCLWCPFEEKSYERGLIMVKRRRNFMKSLLVVKKIWPIRNIRDEQMFLESPSKPFFFL